MKHLVLLVTVFLSCITGGIAQKLTFKATYSGNQVNLDAVVIKNMIRDCDTVLVWPDTILDLDALGIEDNISGKLNFEVFQNTPNPVNGKTTVKVNMPSGQNVLILVSDMTGQKIASLDRKLSKGVSYFELSPGNHRSLIFTVVSGSEKRSIKIISSGTSDDEFRLTYKGSESGRMIKSTKDNDFTFGDNDMLEFTGIYNNQTMKIYDIPEGNETYIFNFTPEEVIAAFSYEIDPLNPYKVTFTNQSQNAESYQWNFGDGNSSVNVNPIHIYQAEGDYVVTLTATNSLSTDNVSQVISIHNSVTAAMILTGGSQKTWKLIRDVSTGVYPLQVGPQEGLEFWWAFGYNNTLAERPCMLNDEWTFTSTGQMLFDDMGDYWAEGSIYPDDADDMCASSDVMINADGIDVSAWSSGIHQWNITTDDMLTVTGLGAYIGLCKAGNNEEVTVPQQYVTYQILKLTDGPTDTLIVQANFLIGYEQIPSYWRFALVHYDNPEDEPPMPTYAPESAFSFEISNNTVTFINQSVNGESYLWDFGDGNTSTEASPVYTYAYPGAYHVKLTVTNSSGVDMASRFVYVGSAIINEQILQGTWKIKDAEDVIFVGPSLGSNEWWSVPYEDLQPDGAWYCIMNDEFIFSPGGVYEYRTNGDARNDGFVGQMSGCYSDTELLSMDFPFMSATHSYEIISQDSNSRIILTNGSGNEAAFIGFYKGYYGGENINNPPNGGLPTNRYEVLGYYNNGTTENLFLSVDLNGPEPGGSAWSFRLEKTR